MGESKKVKLSPPWLTYFHEVEALFKEDPEVRVKFVEDLEHPTIEIYVDNADKAEALEELLPDEKTLGNVTCDIFVIPANLRAETKEKLFRKAFANNPAVKDVIVVDDIYSFSAGYVVFSGDPVQFFDDNLSDINGMKTMLYQDVAKDIFGDVGGMFFFCTEKL